MLKGLAETLVGDEEIADEGTEGVELVLHLEEGVDAATERGGGRVREVGHGLSVDACCEG
jgi:hypothetical protein